MIIITNLASQELAPGQSLAFDTEILHTGCAECHRIGSGAVTLRQQQAIYEAHFSANVGTAAAAGVSQLAIAVNGSPLIETTMISTTGTAASLNNVSKDTALRTCCCGPETITVVNTGETTVTVENPSLFIKRIA